MTPVVFLIRNVAACDFGGGEIYQLRLANELRINGFRPVIISNSVILGLCALNFIISILQTILNVMNNL